MKNIFKNWKTTLLGALAIAASVYHCVQTGHVDIGCLVGLFTGGGLVAAKDGSTQDAAK